MPFDSAINSLATRIATEFNAVYTALSGKAAILTGEIKLWPTGSAPTGYLLCAGGSFSSATYPALATLLGDTYGVHSGTTYFLPDFRGRSPLGVGTASPAVPGGTAHTLAQKGGEETHALTIAELASHTHVQNAHTHTTTQAYVYQQDLATYYFNVPGGSSGTQRAADTNAMSSTTATNQNTGSGTGHNNLSPYLGINFIIKT